MDLSMFVKTQFMLRRYKWDKLESTLGNLVGIGQNAGVNTYGAADYGQNYGAQTAAMQANYNAANAAQTNLAGQYGQHC